MMLGQPAAATASAVMTERLDRLMASLPARPVPNEGPYARSGSQLCESVPSVLLRNRILPPNLGVAARPVKAATGIIDSGATTGKEEPDLRRERPNRC